MRPFKEIDRSSEGRIRLCTRSGKVWRVWPEGIEPKMQDLAALICEAYAPPPRVIFYLELYFPDGQVVELAQLSYLDRVEIVASS